MAEGFLLDRDAILKLRADHEELTRQVKLIKHEMLRALQRPQSAREDQVIAKVQSELSARTTLGNSNELLGSGTVAIFDSDSQELKTSGREVTAYNIATDTIAADEYVRLTRHFATGDWMAVSAAASGVELHRVILKENMGATTANQASADLYTLAGVDTGTDITVLDSDGLFPGSLGPRTHPVTSNTLVGAKGLVIKSGTSYFAVELEQAARWIKFSVDNASGYTTTDASWSIAIANYWNGQEPAVSLAYNLEIKQTAEAGTEHLFEGSDGAIGLAVYDDTQNLYRITQIEFECP